MDEKSPSLSGSVSDAPTDVMRPSDRRAHVHTYGFMGIKAKAESCITIRVPSTATPRLVLSSEHDCMQGHVGLLSVKAVNGQRGREGQPPARGAAGCAHPAARLPRTTSLTYLHVGFRDPSFPDNFATFKKRM